MLHVFCAHPPHTDHMEITSTAVENVQYWPALFQRLLKRIPILIYPKTNGPTAILYYVVVIVLNVQDRYHDLRRRN